MGDNIIASFVRIHETEKSLSPMLNMAIPVPDLDMMSTDPSKALGSSMCSLFSEQRQQYYSIVRHVSFDRAAWLASLYYIIL